MNWLIIQSDGEHKGQDGWCPNWHFRECYAIQHALQANGQSAVVWGKRHAGFEQVPDFSSYDFIFNIENYEFEWIPELKKYPHQTRIQWVIDAHCQTIENYAPTLRNTDVVLQSTRRYVDYYSSQFPGQKHLYFPNGVDSRYFDKSLYGLTVKKREMGLIFIGGLPPGRKYRIEHMQRYCGLLYSYPVTGMDYVRALLDAKIQFNSPVYGDINYRNFETIGMGTCLLTQYDEELENLGFKHEENCLFYHTLGEAEDLSRTYLANDKWCSVADAGYEFSKQHTYIKRIGDLIKTLKTL